MVLQAAEVVISEDVRNVLAVGTIVMLGATLALMRVFHHNNKFGLGFLLAIFSSAAAGFAIALLLARYIGGLNLILIVILAIVILVVHLRLLFMGTPNGNDH